MNCRNPHRSSAMTILSNTSSFPPDIFSRHTISIHKTLLFWSLDYKCDSLDALLNIRSCLLHINVGRCARLLPLLNIWLSTKQLNGKMSPPSGQECRFVQKGLNLKPLNRFLQLSTSVFAYSRCIHQSILQCACVLCDTDAKFLFPHNFDK